LIARLGHEAAAPDEHVAGGEEPRVERQHGEQGQPQAARGRAERGDGEEGGEQGAKEGIERIAHGACEAEGQDEPPGMPPRPARARAAGAPSWTVAGFRPGGLAAPSLDRTWACGHRWAGLPPGSARSPSPFRAHKHGTDRGTTSTSPDPVAPSTSPQRLRLDHRARDPCGVGLYCERMDQRGIGKKWTHGGCG